MRPITHERIERIMTLVAANAKHSLIESEVRTVMLEQDHDSRHACAEAVALLAATKGTLLFVELTRAHSACMNAQAI